MNSLVLSVLISYVVVSSQPIDGDVLGWECLRHSPSPTEPSPHPHQYCGWANAVAGLALMVLIMTAGCTSARNDQGTFKNKIYYSQILAGTQHA